MLAASAIDAFSGKVLPPQGVGPIVVGSTRGDTIGVAANITEPGTLTVTATFQSGRHIYGEFEHRSAQAKLLRFAVHPVKQARDVLVERGRLSITVRFVFRPARATGVFTEVKSLVVHPA
jgi:hypothetical protein